MGHLSNTEDTIFLLIWFIITWFYINHIYMLDPKCQFKADFVIKKYINVLKIDCGVLVTKIVKAVSL